jgi:hypothetical protein
MVDRKRTTKEMEPTQMRLEENHENWLKFANDYWELDNGRSAVELGKDMIMKHVKKARDSSYGYTGELDETLAHAQKVIEATDRENLKDAVDSLCDLGEIDAVTRALKNVTFGAVQKSTGVKPQPFLGSGVKITAGGNRSAVKFNGVTVKRSQTKSFSDVVDAPTKAFNRVVADNLNLSPKVKSILKEAMARNATKAASTIDIPARKRLNQEKHAVTKFADDEDTLEGTWSSHMKKDAVEASGRMKSGTEAAKTVEIPVVRLNSFEDTRARMPFEFRGVNQSETVPVGFNLGATVDVVNPNGSAHGPIEFNTDGTQAVTYYDQGKATLPQYRGGKANNGEPKQHPRKPSGDTGSNIESGGGHY